MNTRKHTLCLVSLIMLFLFSSSCRQGAKHHSAVIVNETLLDSIPSGSGMERYNDSILIISDDARYMYQLSLDDYKYKTLLVSHQAAINNRINKGMKPDYESAALLNFRGGTYLLSFGSGSSAPARDSLLIINLNDFKLDTVLNIKRFYDHLRKISNTDANDWNLEAATVLKDKMVLFNRGNNRVYSFNAADFVDYILTTGTTPPQIRYFTASLPSIENYPARLSGSSVAGEELLFSASVEKTKDWKMDGPVLGSFIGLMTTDAKVISIAPLVYKDGSTSKDKIESVAFSGYPENGGILLFAIADNDDGKTKLLEIHLKE